MIEPLLDSPPTLRKPRTSQPSAQLAAEVHATARAQEILSKDITEIKNILATPVSSVRFPSFLFQLRTFDDIMTFQTHMN
jgi:hypothetical protein